MSKKTICATCDYLDREDAKKKNPKVWQCLAPRTRIIDFVTGGDKQRWLFCRNKNTGNCRHWCPHDTTDLMAAFGIKPKSWWSRTFTKKFWSGVFYNTIIDLLVLGTIYLWVKTHGGITPW